MTRRRRLARRIRNTSILLFLVVLGTSFDASPGSAVTPGEAGTDTSLPRTDSAVTASGRGAFADLEITVNQTKDLVNQAVSISWTGGTPTVSSGTRFGANFLQVMQCWGDPDPAIPDNPGPPPEQCVFGASQAVFGGRGGVPQFPPGSLAHARRLGTKSWPGFNPDEGQVADNGSWWRPFRSVDGEVVVQHEDPTFNPAIEGGQFWLNPYFNVITTNEIPGGYTCPDGTGDDVFEVATGLENSGLGCGQKVLVVDGEPTEPKCWLVVVPRGAVETENVGCPCESAQGVMTSPLTDRAWQHRIAIPLDFNPVDSGCDIGQDPRRMIGSELPLEAITSWQRPLCDTPGLPPYAYGITGDVNARQQLVTASRSTGLAVVSRPIDPTLVDGSNPVVYVPLTLSATVIGFNIERIPNLSSPAEEIALAGRRVERVNLTPRLVAKLLTQSYAQQTRIIEPPPSPAYDWAKENPTDLTKDPDFLKFNPEFEFLIPSSVKSFGGLVMPSRTSDLASQVWEWILADPEAKAWLDGEPDEWGMVINPVYSTSAEHNTSGAAFGDPVPDSFPKSDPHCYQAPENSIAGVTYTPPLMCGTDWLPYSSGLREAARATRAADDGSRTLADPFAITPSTYFRRTGPHIAGQRGMLSITDSPSATRFGLQAARLSRAGDNGDDRRFLAPDDGGVSEAVASMQPGAVPDVLEPDAEADAPDAYPLAALTYAAVRPLVLDQQARAEYAAFLEYAVGDGQLVGLKGGQLPPGYSPLPPALRAQAREAVKEVLELEPAGTPNPTTTPASAAEGSSEGLAATTGSGFSASPSLGSSAPISNAFDPSVLPSLPAESEPEESPAAGAGALTPILALANSRFVLPVLALIALLSALGAVEITRRPGPQPLSAGGRPDDLPPASPASPVDGSGR